MRLLLIQGFFCEVSFDNVKRRVKIKEKKRKKEIEVKQERNRLERN
jgi:hypothetical protein